MKQEVKQCFSEPGPKASASPANEDMQPCLGRLLIGAPGPATEGVPTPKSALSGDEPITNFQKAIVDHPNMFKHSDYLLRHTPFGLSVIDPDQLASEPSAATIETNCYLLPTPRDAKVGTHDVGVPDIDDGPGDVHYTINRVAEPKTLSKAAARLATKQLCE